MVPLRNVQNVNLFKVMVLLPASRGYGWRGWLINFKSSGVFTDPQVPPCANVESTAILAVSPWYFEHILNTLHFFTSLLIRLGSEMKGYCM